jgi:hypothetical protein
VPVVRQASSKRWAIIKHIFWATFTSPQLLVERVGLLPVFKNSFFLWCKNVQMYARWMVPGKSDFSSWRVTPPKLKWIGKT